MARCPGARRRRAWTVKCCCRSTTNWFSSYPKKTSPRRPGDRASHADAACPLSNSTCRSRSRSSMGRTWTRRTTPKDCPIIESCAGASSSSSTRPGSSFQAVIESFAQPLPPRVLRSRRDSIIPSWIKPIGRTSRALLQFAALRSILLHFLGYAGAGCPLSLFKSPAGGLGVRAALADRDSPARRVRPRGRPV